MKDKIKYPSGKCEWCGKVFERPHKFRTEIEAFHTYGCRLDGIENAINNKEEIFDIEGLIEEIEAIAKISSFGAREGNEYWKRMERCGKIIRKLKNE